MLESLWGVRLCELRFLWFYSDSPGDYLDSTFKEATFISFQILTYSLTITIIFTFHWMLYNLRCRITVVLLCVNKSVNNLNMSLQVTYAPSATRYVLNCNFLLCVLAGLTLSFWLRTETTTATTRNCRQMFSAQAYIERPHLTIAFRNT
jgi:hypothetical protein